MTEPGQTDNYSVSDHLNAIIDHCGKGIVDYCIYDTGEIVPEFIKKYNLEGQDLVEQDIEKVKGIKFLQRDLSMIADGHIRHDPNLVATSIIELICDDLKYQDKQNDPQYLMLNTKLREDKRISKMKRHAKKENVKKANSDKANSGLKKKSKFSNKYSQRIASIKEADEKMKRKAELEKNKKEKASSKTAAKKAVKTEKRIVKEETKYEKIKENIDRNNRVSKTQKNDVNKEKIEFERPKREIKSSDKTRNEKARKKTPQEIREEMLRKLDESKLK